MRRTAALLLVMLWPGTPARAASPDRERVDQELARIAEIVADVQHDRETAKTARDLVEYSCLSDKLTQLEAWARQAQEHDAAWRAAGAGGQTEAAAHELALLDALGQRVESLGAEADQCVGQEIAFAPEIVAVFYVLDSGPEAAAYRAMTAAYQRGAGEEALRQGLQMLALVRQRGAGAWRELEARLDLAVILTDLGRYPEAAGDLAALSEWFGKRPRDPELLINLGVLQRLRGDLSAARGLLEEAAERTRGAREPFLHQAALANLGTVLFELGSLVEARQVLGDAAAAPDGTVPPGFAAKVATNLALIDYREGHLVEARTRLRDLVRHAPPDDRRRASLLNDLAEVERARGHFAAARPLVEQALVALTAQYGEAHPAVANAQHTLAQIERALGNLDRADQLYGAALATARAGLGSEHPFVALVLADRATLAGARGDAEAALAMYREVVAIDEHTAVMVLPSATELQRRGYLNLLRDHLDALLSQHLRAPSAASTALAARAILAHKGRALDVVVASLQPPGETERELARLVFYGPRSAGLTSDAYRERIRTLQAKLAATRGGGSIQALPPELLDRVVAQIPAGAELLELLVHRPEDPRSGGFGEPRYLALLAGAAHATRLVDLGPAAPIDALAAAFRRAVASPAGDPSPAARALRRAVLDPLALPAGTRRLLLSPDGALNLVPFEAFEDDDGKRLIERLELTYLTSGRDLVRSAPASAAASPMVLIADPVMANPRWAALPGTRGEAKAIHALFPDATLLLGAQATRAALEGAEAPLAVHIASHGFFLPQARYLMTDAQAVVTRGLVLEDRPVPTGLAIDPLARAGVILSPSGPGDDGVLSALELATLHLGATRLVVLSACDTGLGEIELGQGIYGLRRALVLAGAHSQVISLWKVDDDATRELMTAFYQGLQGGQRPSQALRAAQLALLGRPATAHPYFWAAFIPSGDSGAVDASLPPRIARGHACGCAVGTPGPRPGALLLVLGLLLVARRRR